jgi:hypothetical protein
MLKGKSDKNTTRNLMATVDYDSQELARLAMDVRNMWNSFTAG